jgi:hypothetical protein
MLQFSNASNNPFISFQPNAITVIRLRLGGAVAYGKLLREFLMP